MNELSFCLCRADIVELANARVIQRGDGPCFPFAPFCELCLENPDDDDTIDASVAGLPLP